MAFTFLKKIEKVHFSPKRLVWYAERGGEASPEIKTAVQQALQNPENFIRGLDLKIQNIDNEIARYAQVANNPQYKAKYESLQACRQSLIEVKTRLDQLRKDPQNLELYRQLEQSFYTMQVQFMRGVLADAYQMADMLRANPQMGTDIGIAVLKMAATPELKNTALIVVEALDGETLRNIIWNVLPLLPPHILKNIMQTMVQNVPPALLRTLAGQVATQQAGPLFGGFASMGVNMMGDQQLRQMASAQLNSRSPLDVARQIIGGMNGAQMKDALKQMITQMDPQQLQIAVQQNLPQPADLTRIATVALDCMRPTP